VYTWAVSHGYSFDNAGLGTATDHPVQTVSWYDCVKWCNARSATEGRTPVYYTDAGLTQVYQAGRLAPYVNWSVKGYRLPTEAEWEKAARGGASGHRFPWSDMDTIDHTRADYWGDPTMFSYDLGYDGYDTRYDTTGYPYTSPVGTFAPNGYGLYDMAGNLWEWCWDWQGAYGSGSQGDPRGPSTGQYRGDRGGYWGNVAYYCRVAFRGANAPDVAHTGLGFRAVLPSGQ